MPAYVDADTEDNILYMSVKIIFDHMKPFTSLSIVFAAAAVAAAQPATPARSGNPILPGWYADPEAHVFDGRYWIFPTYSAPYDQQTFLDAFSSRDLVTWEKHSHVLDIADVPWAQARRVGAVDRREGRLVLPLLRRE